MVLLWLSHLSRDIQKPSVRRTSWTMDWYKGKSTSDNHGFYRKTSENNGFFFTRKALENPCLPGKHLPVIVQRCLQILGKLHGLRIFSGFLKMINTCSLGLIYYYIPISVHEFHRFKMAGSHGCYGWVLSGNLTVCYWKCTIYCWFTHSKRWFSSSLCKRLPEGMDRPNRRMVCFTKTIFANGRFQGEFLGLN